MKALRPRCSVEMLCRLFGKSRQAFYKVKSHAERQAMWHGQILTYIRQEREDQPRLGVDKLQYMLRQHQDIHIGRDALYNLLRANNLLVRRAKKYRPPTTNGDGMSIYPDLRKHLKVSKIHQLWSTDITYLSIRKGRARHCYATFMVDEYSHFIVGYTVAEDMTALSTLQALKMAVETEQPPEDKSLVFHTDRGSQFKSTDFQNYLADHKIRPSMTQDGKPEDNPVSERLNGILKEELLDGDTFEHYEQARQMVSRAVHIYNTRRPHRSCQMLTPQQAHTKGSGPLKKLWRQRKKTVRPSTLT